MEMNMDTTTSPEFTLEEMITQDFFLQSILMQGELKCFLLLARLNKLIYEKIKKYTEKQNIWKYLCEKHFVDWIPGNDEMWKFHFSQLKSENYFGLYCYIYKILNYKHYISKDQKIITICIPLYFALKKYNTFGNAGLLTVSNSTRKMALVERIMKEPHKEYYTLEEIFSMKLRMGIFSYIVCHEKDCFNLPLSCTFSKKNNLFTDYHIRDEDVCSGHFRECIFIPQNQQNSKNSKNETEMEIETTTTIINSVFNFIQKEDLPLYQEYSDRFKSLK